MQTNLADFIRDSAQGQEAEAILRSCVHCGFCNATCPTYQLLGDELDGPRGRIYLIKQMLEGQPVGAVTRLHLDRCLSCRNCETTCPSGVQYGRLIDIGRDVVEQLSPRPAGERLLRVGLRKGLQSPALFGAMLKLGQSVRGLLPPALRQHLPPTAHNAAGGVGRRAPNDKTMGRRMLVLEGCVQPGLAPEINAAAARVLARLGIGLFSAPEAGCCGAIDQHLAAPEAAKAAMRRNIDAWWPHLENNIEAIVMTASGCGSTVKEYGHHLRHDPAYADKAARVSALTRDLAEVLRDEDLSSLNLKPPPAVKSKRIAFHPPCSLQHGQKLRGVIENILTRAGYELLPVDEAHLCCGSAGTYSILQPELSGQLRARKLANLQAREPELIASANIGCQSHLAAASAVPVVHWITLLDR
ncbi:MAG: glycolate oxidase iron-sulfur subunit [Hydrogenophilales bacterium 28-61-23]|nr:MAG: glycolate oxidase iron-sulfur subunit [Hydrogenophilales bacterium 28-61-23]